MTALEKEPVQRLDKWLFYARFVKSRGLASRLCAAGRVRINRARTTKAHQTLKVGDVLTFPQGSSIRVVRVVALSERRGSARDAARLYADLSEPDAASAGGPGGAREGAKKAP
ncbi:MAG: RNA-binding S4 domain-containing protein [Proteobacteria bacterium]|nr:RNA-binding S4 domain-containing protein [Pseudomonadota bacterium]